MPNCFDLSSIFDLILGWFIFWKLKVENEKREADFISDWDDIT